MLKHIHEPHWSRVRIITRFDRDEVVMNTVDNVEVIKKSPHPTLTLNFSGSPTKAGSVKSLLFFEHNEGSVLGLLISGDHKMGLTRSPAAEKLKYSPK